VVYQLKAKICIHHADIQNENEKTCVKDYYNFAIFKHVNGIQSLHFVDAEHFTM